MLNAARGCCNRSARGPAFVGQAAKNTLVEAFVAQAAVEVLDVTIPLGMRRAKKQCGRLFSEDCLGSILLVIQPIDIVPRYRDQEQPCSIGAEEGGKRFVEVADGNTFEVESG